ncbi:MAG: hypothetical protein IPM84_21490 [Anaerolineae bacterium]|nr:hypothetical protein [Anaerolineae bacterium]
MWLTPGEGGVLVSADGRVQVEVPPGAVSQPTQLRYRSLPAAPADGLIAVFALKQRRRTGDFGQPVSLRVRITAAEARVGWKSAAADLG